MALYLVVKAGPLRGKRFPIEKGFVVSREKGQICLEDPKVSRRHAEVIQDSKGQLLLKDLGSRNGLKVQGKKKTQVPLLPGTKVVVGKTELEVVESQSSNGPSQGGQPLATKVSPDPSHKAPSSNIWATSKPPPTDASKEVELPPLEWHEVLGQICKGAEKSTKDKGKNLLPFTPPVSLCFSRGLQAETQWTLGYGPRQAGQRSADLPILDDRAPDVCFELRPTSKGPEFLTQHPQQVLLNDQPIKSDVLKDGDTITINDILITVSIGNETN